MIDIQKEIQCWMVLESKKPKHLFNDDSLTFKDLKDVFSDVFSTQIVKISRRVPMVSLYLTNKNGNFFISAIDKPRKLLKVNAIGNAMKLNEGEAKHTENSVSKIISTLSGINPVLLNRYFANGNNRLKISFICPPECGSGFYDGGCFVQFDGIDCFGSDGKLAGSDNKSGVELLKILKAKDALAGKLADFGPDQLNALKRYKSEKSILDSILARLRKLVDGIGWGCTIKYYVHDRLSRYLINKALEHGLDVSKNGTFVDELASRLSGMAVSCPTKSDLVTFAKREGINCNSEAYKNFLNDIEEAAPHISRDIAAPIEKIVYFALAKAANNVAALAALDPNPRAKKTLLQAQVVAAGADDDIGKCDIDAETIEKVCAAFKKLCVYADIAPAEIRVMNAGRPYAVFGDLSKLQKLCSVTMR